MELQLFKTLWGHIGSFDDALAHADADGFDGIEGPAPTDAEQWGEALAKAGLSYIAEICTAGSYVPERDATVAEHLTDFERKLQQSLPLKPRFATCIGGCDAWRLAQSLSFFNEAQAIADHYSLTVSFETHRSRSLFNPWITLEVLDAIPDLKLTCDFSHWCVVCERSLDTEADALARVAAQAFHIHARVGYDQGPQVPDPRAPEHAEWLHAHERWWQQVWLAQLERRYPFTTMTPEFGPDGYLHEQPFTREPVADLRELNRWIARRQRKNFSML